MTMIPDTYIALATEILRLINNILEGTPIEQRKANAILWFNGTWPLVKGLFPEATQKQIEEIMKGIK